MTMITRRRALSSVAGMAALMNVRVADAREPDVASSPLSPYAPTWNSLKRHHNPQWLSEAKFGIYTHWGPPKASDLAMWKPDKFDPEAWAELIQSAGARFAGPVSEHGVQVAMWDSKLTDRSIAKQGLKRDVMGEVKAAPAKRGIRFLASFHAFGSRTESVLTPWTKPYQLCSVISGIPGYLIEDLKLSDIYARSQGGAGGDAAKVNPPEKEGGYPEPTMFGPTPAHGFYIRHARNVEISRVEMALVNSDVRPAIVLDDVHRADLLGVQAPYTAGQPIVSVRSGSDLRILQSRNIKDVALNGEVNHREF